ncbi:MAG: ATP-dependent metallopeptidase FtsH/Yme1/Tma family protein [Chlamydiae bacterium]|nr:ATP-dependent metallopeptidase FtsH/Yme1/Tma family protein [Chlamydiota bacterium]
MADLKKLGMKSPQRGPVRPAVLWLVVFIGIMLAFHLQRFGDRGVASLSFSQFQRDVREGKVVSFTLVEDSVSGRGVYRDGGKFTVETVPGDAARSALTGLLNEHEVEIRVEPSKAFVTQVIFTFLPIVLIAGIIWFLISRQMRGVGHSALSFGKSRARLLAKGDEKVTFSDVAGIDEAKEEVQEIIDFLKDPKRFQKLGGKIPKGVMLIGPPGCGKTLLAKAIAGEADVPFFSISGSDFVEMFVGVGAARVRDLFEQGKKSAPCLIFMDEIDAVGRYRGAGIGGGHDEREQTLNALLVEMDGFNTQEGVILIAATNRPDVLDPALLRPGRFDRQIVIDMPDLRGREEILKVHVKNVPLDPSVELGVIARGTPGFSGADLANLVNEAALLAARQDKKSVMMEDLEEARDKVRWGRERRSKVMDEKDRKTTAYHEAGHALVLNLIEETEPLHKVTIIPRGIAYLGATMQLPEKDKYHHSRKELLGQISGMMGGRIAEEIVFGDITTGARSDIKQATHIARMMVCEWGMSGRLGPVTFGEREEHIFLGKEIARTVDYSEKTAQEIDREVRLIVDGCYQRAREIVLEHRDTLDRIAQALLDREVLDGKEIDALMRGEELPPLRRPAPPGGSAPATGAAPAAPDKAPVPERLRPSEA